MKRMCLLLAAIGAVAGMSGMNSAAIAAPPTKPLTVAVFGDWPYSQSLLTNAPLLLNSVNNDPDVRLVIHVGDIHSGQHALHGCGIESDSGRLRPRLESGDL